MIRNVILILLVVAQRVLSGHHHLRGDVRSHQQLISTEKLIPHHQEFIFGHDIEEINAHPRPRISAQQVYGISEQKKVHQLISEQSILGVAPISNRPSPQRLSAAAVSEIEESKHPHLKDISSAGH